MLSGGARKTADLSERGLSAATTAQRLDSLFAYPGQLQVRQNRKSCVLKPFCGVRVIEEKLFEHRIVRV